MNNKEYGVKLNVDISNFTSKLNDAKNYTKEVMNEIKEKIKEPMEEVGETSKNSFTGRLEEVGRLSGEMANLTMEYANAVALEGKQSESALQLKERIHELNKEIEAQGDELEKVGDALSELFDEEEKATDGMSRFGSVVDNVKNGAKGMSVSFFKFGDGISKSVTKGVNSLKRFTLSLLGIRGLYTMLTRASNAYMAQDNQLHTRLQANWIALGAMLAPIIERIVSLFQRLVAYVNVFWKAFTGKNLIDVALKKVQKTAKGTTKAVKELNKEIANIDEITNLNFDQGGGNIDAGGIEEDAYGLEDALNEIKNMQLNPQIVQVIEWIAKKLKDVWDWCVKVKDKLAEWGISLNDILVIAGTLYGAFKISKLYNSISKVIGVSGGTTGLYGMLTVFGMLVDFQLAHKLGNQLAELSDALYDKKEAEESFAQQQVAGLEKMKEKIKENNQKLTDGNLTEEERTRLIKINQQCIERSQEIYEEYLRRLKDGKKYTKEQREEIEKQTKAIEKVSGQTYRTTIKAKVEEDLQRNSFIYKLIHGILPEIHLPGGGGGSRHFAKGNVAYQPTYAEFGEYAGARSNPEITAPQNMMRETLFEALSDALPLVGNNGGGDTVLYVNGRELARATYSDFQAESNRVGNSSVAVRRTS